MFGSVTCLPGWFTLFRLCTPDTHKPLLISNQIVLDYSQDCVDLWHTQQCWSQTYHPGYSTNSWSQYVTKREIRCQLEEHFSMDLTARKATINATIDRTLLVQSWYVRTFICLDSIRWTTHYGCTLVCGPNCLYSMLTTLARGTFVNSLRIMNTNLHIFIIISPNP